MVVPSTFAYCQQSDASERALPKHGYLRAESLEHGGTITLRPETHIACPPKSNKGPGHAIPSNLDVATV
jgi:hypothetical protein